MRRHPILFAFLILGMGLGCIVIYLTAQMRMRTPPQITVVREEWMAWGAVPNARLRIHYEMKNTTIFPVRVSRVHVRGADATFGGDIDAGYPEDVLLLKPRQVHRGEVAVSPLEGKPEMEAVFAVYWEPSCAKRLRPMIYWVDDTWRRLLKMPPRDPFAPPGSSDAPLQIEEHADLLPALRFERPKGQNP